MAIGYCVVCASTPLTLPTPARHWRESSPMPMRMFPPTPRPTYLRLCIFFSMLKLIFIPVYGIKTCIVGLVSVLVTPHPLPGSPSMTLTVSTDSSRCMESI
jgi:hypothetical protein